MSIPKGKLIAIGGAEDKGTDLEAGDIYRNNLNFFELGILRRIMQEAGGPAARIEVITTASTIPQEVASNPSCIGIGLGEDTGMLVTEGNKMEAIGSGLVIIIDGHDIRHCNIADIPEGNPISVENIIVHFCEKGNGYMINERKFLM